MRQLPVAQNEATEEKTAAAHSFDFSFYVIAPSGADMNEQPCLNGFTQFLMECKSPY